MCSGLRPLRPAGFIPARPYQSECAAGGRYGALETALDWNALTPALSRGEREQRVLDLLVDGEEAVKFLVHVKEQIEDPRRMMLGI